MVFGTTLVHSVLPSWFFHWKCHCVCCRTSARLLETKAANTSSQYNAATGKNSTAAKNPTVVLALDRVNSEGATYSTGQAPSVPNGAHYSMSSTVGGKPSLYGGTQGWETVRRIFNPHRGESTPVSKLSWLHKHLQHPCSVTPLLSHRGKCVFLQLQDCKKNNRYKQKKKARYLHL